MMDDGDSLSFKLIHKIVRSHHLNQSKYKWFISLRKRVFQGDKSFVAFEKVSKLR